LQQQKSCKARPKRSPTRMRCDNRAKILCKRPR
jgi:hypothetical protein